MVITNNIWMENETGIWISKVHPKMNLQGKKVRSTFNLFWCSCDMHNFIATQFKNSKKWNDYTTVGKRLFRIIVFPKSSYNVIWRCVACSTMGPPHRSIEVPTSVHVTVRTEMTPVERHHFPNEWFIFCTAAWYLWISRNVILFCIWHFPEALVQGHLSIKSIQFW